MQIVFRQIVIKYQSLFFFFFEKDNKKYQFMYAE